MRKYYPLVRALHLYFGLFISPFVIIFSFSVFVFNHPGIINRISSVKTLSEIKTKLNEIPYDTTDLATAKAISRKLNIKGDIDFISKNDSSFSFPVNKPGLRTYIKVNTNTDSVLISRKYEGAFRSMSFLHSMPGPHNIKTRGNSGYMKVWKVLADIVVYLLLFLTVSGVLLWYILKSERIMGLYALALGIVFFISVLVMIF